MESLKPNDANCMSVVLEGKRVAIATPCYGNSVTSQYLQSLAATIPELIKYGVSYDMMTLTKESIVSRARNTIAATFLENKADYLFYIDADMGWDAVSFLRMLASGKEFVGAAGPRKEFPITFCANLAQGPLDFCPNTGLIKAQEIGTGFLCLKRSVLEKVAASEPENFFYDATRKDHFKVHSFFENSVVAHKFWSEDYTFCHKWRNLGGEIWVDPTVSLQHVGEHTWQGAFQEQLLKKETTDASNS